MGTQVLIAIAAAILVINFVSWVGWNDPPRARCADTEIPVRLADGGIGCAVGHK